MRLAQIGNIYAHPDNVVGVMKRNGADSSVIFLRTRVGGHFIIYDDRTVAVVVNVINKAFTEKSRS